MEFWNIFRANEVIRPSDSMIFGRYSEAGISESKLQIWDKSIAYYESGDYKSSILELLYYLINENNPNNVIINESNNLVDFSIHQGSKIVTGYFNNQYFRSEVQIAKGAELKIGLLRELTEITYELEYGRFALNKEDIITLVFDSYIEESSPYKLFYGLKEIALFADKKDDVLLVDFKNLKPINNAITIAVPDSEKLIKWDLLKKLISDCNNDTDENKNTLDKFQGAHTYILLAAIYKIDYLIKPESKIMEYIENADKDYFIDKSTDLTSKIKLLQECINNISEIPQSQFYNEIYNVVSTFSWTNHSSHSQIKDVIEAELKTFNWFYENKNYNICEAICSYIVGYLLYHFSLIPPIKELLQFYLELVEPQFFSKLNGTEGNDVITSLMIKKRINKISEKYKSKYPALEFISNTKNDDFHLNLRNILLTIQSYQY